MPLLSKYDNFTNWVNRLDKNSRIPRSSNLRADIISRYVKSVSEAAVFSCTIRNNSNTAIVKTNVGELRINCPDWLNIVTRNLDGVLRKRKAAVITRNDLLKAIGSQV